MSENSSIPTLTLDPNATQAAVQAATLEEEIKAAAGPEANEELQPESIHSQQQGGCARNGKIQSRGRPFYREPEWL